MGEQFSGLNVGVAEAIEVAAPSTEPAENSAPVTAETDSPEGELPQETIEQKLQPQTFEEIVAEVEEYFGGRIFTFKSHTGTAAQIADMCPMAKMAFMRGKEFAMSFLEQFDETGKEEPAEDEPAAEEEDSRLLADTEDAVPQAQRVAEQATRKAVEAKADMAITKTNVAQVAISAVMHEPAKNMVTPVDAAAQSAENRRVVDIAPPSAKVMIELTVAEASPLPLPIMKHEAKPQQESRSHSKKKERQEVVLKPSAQEAVTTELESPTVVDSMETNEPGKEKEFEQVARKVETVQEPAEFIEVSEAVTDDFQQEPKDESEEISEEKVFAVEEETLDEEAVVPADISEEPEKATDLFETIADQLGIEHDKPNVPMETTESLESETPSIAPLLEIIEQIIDQPEENQPLIKQRLVEVVRSIEILKWARSAEECREAVDGLKTNLTLLLEELGCDDPDLLTVELLERYGVQSIDEIMNTALKVVRSKRSHSPRFASVRHLLIGRHVMKLLFGDISGDLLRYAGPALSH